MSSGQSLLLATCCSQPKRFIIESFGDELAQPTTHYVYKKKVSNLNYYIQGALNPKMVFF
jgi:hypothetical protein